MADSRQFQKCIAIYPQTFVHCRTAIHYSLWTVTTLNFFKIQDCGRKCNHFEFPIVRHCRRPLFCGI